MAQAVFACLSAQLVILRQVAQTQPWHLASPASSPSSPSSQSRLLPWLSQRDRRRLSAQASGSAAPASPRRICGLRRLVDTIRKSAYRLPMKTTEEIRNLLKKACEKAGGQAAWARRNGVSAQFVGDVLLGNRSPGKRIASVFGFEPVTMYRKNTPK